MLQFPIIEVKDKRLESIHKFIKYLTFSIVGITIVYTIICIQLGDSLPLLKLNQFIVAFGLLTLLLCSTILIILRSITIIISTGNYKEIGVWVLNTELCLIQMENGESFSLLSNDITKIKIEYQNYEYNNAMKFPTLEPLRISSGANNIISFTYNNNQYSFLFLSKQEEDEQKIINMINNNLLLRDKVVIS